MGKCTLQRKQGLRSSSSEDMLEEETLTLPPSLVQS
jgi:hypothetical protein